MNSSTSKNVPATAWVYKFFYVFVFLFGVAMLTSKSLISLTTVILLILSVTVPAFRKSWMSNTWLLLLMSLFPLALITNYFSTAGFGAVTKLVLSWHWFLLAAPLYCIYLNRKASRFLFAGLTLGLILALGKAGFNFYTLAEGTHGFQNLTDPIRLTSFWDVGRWGFLLGLAILSLFCVVNENIERFQKVFFLILLILSTVFLILSNSRAPLLGLFIALAFLAVTNKNIFKAACLFFFVFGLSFFFNSHVSERVKSIFSVRIEAQKITSSDSSNAGRLQMWKVSKDFFKEQPWFGTGFDLSEVPLKQFVARQSPQYQKDNIGPEFSFNDQHSSYLSFLIQCGFIFSIIFWGLILFLLIREVKDYFYSRDPLSRYCIAGLIYCFVIFIFYSAVLSYECIVFVGLIILTTRHKPKVS